MVGYNVVILYYIYNLLLVIFIANKIVHENTNAILKKKKVESFCCNKLFLHILELLCRFFKWRVLRDFCKALRKVFLFAIKPEIINADYIFTRFCSSSELGIL